MLDSLLGVSSLKLLEPKKQLLFSLLNTSAYLSLFYTAVILKLGKVQFMSNWQTGTPKRNSSPFAQQSFGFSNPTFQSHRVPRINRGDAVQLVELEEHSSVLYPWDL